MNLFARVCSITILILSQNIGTASAQGARQIEPSDFYQWNGKLPDKAGVLLREQTLESNLVLDNAAEGSRILYSSVGYSGDIVPVSGMVFLPKGKAPEGGWPVLAWAHGTTGIADICAPSRRQPTPRDVTYLNHWLGAGYAIVATDYEGLGTPGPHPYLHCESEANSTIYSVQAARQLSAPLADRWLVTGQSQGGHAALCTGAYAGPRAEEFGFLGTLATAPASNFMKHFSDGNPTAPDPFIGLTLMMAQGFETFDPSFDASKVFSERALKLMPMTEKACVHEILEVGANANLTSGDSLKVIPLSKAPGVANAAKYQEIPLTGWNRQPVYIGQGTKDQMVRYEETVTFAEQICVKGAKVILDTYPRAGHSGPMNQGVQAFEAWVAARFAGQEAPNNCGDPGKY